MREDDSIRLLPVHVANKIAAGEVVARPASVAKELIENAIDARATQIDVTVAAGGRKLIGVEDNGVGMSRDNALLCVERHATSKIREVEDIDRIHTLGFRGEALAAIASVSRFRLVSCRSGEASGTELMVSGGKVQDCREIGCPAGTAIEVRDLFFNVPARRKFLRSFQTELSHIRATFLEQALSSPYLGMSLTVDGREVYRLPAGASFEDRLADLFGADFFRRLRPLTHKGPEVEISGFVSLPSDTRADRAEQHVFVNNRCAAAALVSYAIQEAYRGLVVKTRFPSVFLRIDLPPGVVDVNVHPTKKEVRFRHPAAVRDGVMEAIRRALGDNRDADMRAVDWSPQSAALPPATSTQITIEGLPHTSPFQYPRIPLEDISAHKPPPDATNGEERPTDGMPTGAMSPWSVCRVVGLIGELYVVLETEDGYVTMDPRAAHERVLYERFLRDVQEGRVLSQSLLMPETVELGPRDALRVRKNLAVLREMGLGISEFGGDTFVVDALPAFSHGTSAHSLLAEVSLGLERAGARGGKGRWKEECVARAACRSAVRAKDRLTLEEIERLVIDLAGTDMPYEPLAKPPATLRLTACVAGRFVS